MTTGVIPRRVTVVFPDDAVAHGDGQFIKLQHPATGMPCTYFHAPSGLYEVVALDGTNPHASSTNYGNKSRSLLFSDDWIEGSASVLCCTPCSALYLVLPALVQTKERFISIEDLHDHMESRNAPERKHEVLPFELLQGETLELCCDKLDESGVAMYRLNETKLVGYLNAKRDKIVANAPAQLVNKTVTAKLAPVDMQETTPDTVTQLGLEKLAVGLLCSYLNDDAAKIWLDHLDFAQLDDYVTALDQKKADALAAQQQLLESTQADRKRSAPGKLPASKAAKTSARKTASAPPASNKSIMNFFKKK